MNKIVRVVVVDDNDAVVSSIRRYFKDNEAIKIINILRNGKEALDYLVTNPDLYDLIIMDFVLPQCDGIKILEDMMARKINKKVVVLSGFKDDYSLRQAHRLGVSYFMLKPVDMSILEQRVLDLAAEASEDTLAKLGKIEAEVSNILHDLGIPAHVRGYNFIRDGVIMIYESEGFVTSLTKEIYPKVASKYNTTPSRVERAIRHAIEISWSRGDIKLMEEIFGNSVDFERSRPTNAEFLSGIADRFKIKMKDAIR